ncbi:MAG: TetR family transcriptional regulator [Solirubrobacterales bacterium]|nr:TetR family transcriptional regulator [Solirubrobacterales bacterium]
MIRDAEATRGRLIEAATQEFAEHGIAGARVERIAAAAKSNKAQIYHYFGDKAGLLSAVVDCHAEQFKLADYFNADDLGETAARIFDQFDAKPELARLLAWIRLEAADLSDPLAAVEQANAAKIAAIEDAQQRGVVTGQLSAPAILGTILTLASTWSDAALLPEPASEAGSRRHQLIQAVTRLTAP